MEAGFEYVTGEYGDDGSARALPQELADLLQERINQTVFMKFYYRPLLEDARNKSLKAIESLEEELIGIPQNQ